MGALGVSLLVFFGLWAFLTPVLVGGGPLAGCVGACPANVLEIGSVSPEVVVRVGEAETYLGLLTTVCVVLVYALRLGSATRPQRRALIAVGVDVAAVHAGVLRLPLLPSGARDRSRPARDPGLGRDRVPHAAPARLPRGALAGGAVRRACAAPAPGPPDGTAHARAVARRRGGGARRSRPADRLLGSRGRAVPRGRRHRSRAAAGRFRPHLGARRARRAPAGGDGGRRRAHRGSGARARRGVGHGARRGERRPRGRGADVALAHPRGGPRGAPPHRARPARQRPAAPGRAGDPSRPRRRSSSTASGTVRWRRSSASRSTRRSRSCAPSLRALRERCARTGSPPRCESPPPRARSR